MAFGATPKPDQVINAISQSIRFDRHITSNSVDGGYTVQ